MMHNDYYKKDSATMLKFARSIVFTNKDTDNFSLCCTTNKMVITKYYIACFASYWFNKTLKTTSLFR